MRNFVIMCFFGLTLFASESLESLLDSYKQSSELSKKTKKENNGHVIVFTRDDLERMQAESLKDVLKSVRFFRYLESRTGEPDMVNADPLISNTKGIKIYLNDTELAMPIMGSGFGIFGNIDLDFIDHIEVYEGFPSFDFGIEPGLVVIRLYSKIPQRDAGSRVKLLGASHASHKENIYTAGASDELAYFAYANHTQNNQPIYNVDGKTLQRNFTTDHFYGSLESSNYKLELNGLQMKHYAFLSPLPYAVPYDATMKREYLSTTFTTDFLERSLFLHVDYIHDAGQGDNLFMPAITVGSLTFSRMQQKHSSDALTAILKKKIDFDVHDLTLGLQFRYKGFSFDDVRYDGVAVTAKQAYDKEQIYSAFVEDEIILAKKHLISFSVSQQAYFRNKQMKNENITQLRASYVYADQTWSAKTFASSQEFVPEPYMTAAVYQGNPELKPEKSLVLTEEISHTGKQTLTRVVIGVSRNRDAHVSDQQGKIQNLDGYLKTAYISAELNYLFRQKDKFTLQADYFHLNMPNESKVTNHKTFVARMLNSFDKFDIFNELILNAGYTNLKTGYDYSAGVKYRASRDLSFGFKGENIFNSGLTRKYYYNISPVAKQLEVPVIEQKFMLSIEYLF